MWKYVIMCLICVISKKKLMSIVKGLLFYLKKEKILSSYNLVCVCVFILGGAYSF